MPVLSQPYVLRSRALDEIWNLFRNESRFFYIFEIICVSWLGLNLNLKFSSKIVCDTGKLNSHQGQGEPNV